MSGRVTQINVSHGGVPKLPVPTVRVARGGVAGDRQLDRHHHGGPDRAVSVWSLEVIEVLRGEGHPIGPGGAGENLTVSGIDWSAVRPGARLRLAGGVELEVTAFAPPCRTIAGCFAGGAGAYERISDKRHPGSSRVYCRVLAEGEIAAGEGIELTARASAPPTG